MTKQGYFYFSQGAHPPIFSEVPTLKKLPPTAGINLSNKGIFKNEIFSPKQCG
jgi:hypothetical protein